MPYFKETGAFRVGDANAARHGEDSMLTSAHETEQRIGNAFIQDKIDVKNTPLSRLTAITTKVVYYSQNVTSRNDYTINTGNIGTTNLLKMSFRKIKDFIIICQDALNVNVNYEEGKTDLLGEGTAKILPKTIKPLVNDHFVMMTMNKRNLYRITNVTKSSIEDDSAYEISYQLVEENASETLSALDAVVTETNIFVYSHVGKGFRTIFKEEEYHALEKMEEIYVKLAEVYNENFYNKDKNTYILRYDTAVIKDETGVPLEEARIEEIPYIRTGTGKKLEPPKLNLCDSWHGCLMYDRMLIEFITRTKLFFNINGKIRYVTKLQEDLEHMYSKTIFYALENQTTSRLLYRHLIPAPVTRVTIASTLNLYGTVTLDPSPVYNSMCLPMYPKCLMKYMFWEGCENRSVKDISVNVYNDMVDLICETIGLYVNKKEDSILSRIYLLRDNIDEFNDLSILDQNQFYLYPMLAYVLRKMMDRLSDENFGLAMYAQ